jgi:hypothetical protein
MTKKVRNARIIRGAVALLMMMLIGAAILGWRNTMRSGSKAYMVQTLKTVRDVEAQYYNSHNRTYGTFDQMIKEEMLTTEFAANPTIVDDYVLTLTLSSGTKPNSSYSLRADPQNAASDRSHFYLDSNSDRIRLATDRSAGPDDPPAY